MSIRLLGASLAVTLAMAAPAFARTVDCNEDSARLKRVLSRLDGDTTITVKGNCIGNVTIAADGVALVAGDGGASITGQVDVTAQRASISGIDITGPEPSDGTVIRGGLVVRNAGSASFTNGSIANHTKIGVLAVDNGTVTITSSSVTGNGTAHITNVSDGVVATDGGSVFLGAQDANNVPIADASVEIAHNAFRGVFANRSGAVRILAANIHDNGAQAAVSAFSGSLRITGGVLSTPATLPLFDTVVAAFGGTVDILNDTGNPAGNTTINSAFGGVLAVDSGAARLRGVTITTSANATQDPAVGAFRTASIRLQGDNTIISTGGGTALSAGDAGSVRTDDGTSVALPSGANQFKGNVSVTNGGFMRIDDVNPASSITGNITVAQTGTLALQVAPAITGNITVIGPSTLVAAPGPFGFSGTLICFKNGSLLGPINPVIIGVPGVFNPPTQNCTP